MWTFIILGGIGIYFYATLKERDRAAKQSVIDDVNESRRRMPVLLVDVERGDLLDINKRINNAHKSKWDEVFYRKNYFQAEISYDESEPATFFSLPLSEFIRRFDEDSRSKLREFYLKILDEHGTPDEHREHVKKFVVIDTLLPETRLRSITPLN